MKIKKKIEISKYVSPVIEKYCCSNFEKFLRYNFSVNIEVDGIYYQDREQMRISYCPFCGEKVEATGEEIC